MCTMCAWEEARDDVWVSVLSLEHEVPGLELRLSGLGRGALTTESSCQTSS